MAVSKKCATGEHDTCNWHRCKCPHHSPDAGEDYGWPKQRYRQMTDGRVFGYGPRPLAGT